MVDIKNISYIRYAIENPLYKRVDEMTKHRLCGGKNIIYIVPNRYNASIRYRAENMLRTINRLSGYKAYLFEMANMNVLLSNLELVNMVIFQRVICYEIDRYLNCIREKDIPILYDIDDWRFNKDCNHDKRHELNLYLGNMYGTILSQVDMIITTTDYLQDRLCKVFHKKVYLVNNFMDAVQYEISVTLRNKRNQVTSRQDFTIGYFGGESHYRDLEMIAPEIASFLNKHREVKLRIVGMCNIPSPLNREEFENQIIILPYMDGYKLMKEYSKLDINLIPLVMDDFSQSRSEIKFFEAASVGVISIASPTKVYKKIAEETQAIILCDCGSWLNELEKVYNNKYNMEDMIKKAVNYVEKNYIEQAMISDMSRFIFDVEESYEEMLYLGNR